MQNVTIRIIENGKTETSQIKLPAKWEELSQQQIWMIADDLFTKPPHRAKYSLLRNCIAPGLFRRLDAFNLSELGTCLEWLFEKNTLSVNHFSRFKGYYGPANLLEKTTVNEYAKADHCFRNFIQKQKMEDLDKLVACLYRPAKWFLSSRKRMTSYDGNPRQKFNPNLLDNKALKIRRLPVKFKFATLLLFMGCKQKFMEMFPHIFPKNPKKETKKGSWADTKMDLAEASIFGDLNATGETYIITALAYLNKKAKEAKEMEEKYGILK